MSPPTTSGRPMRVTRLPPTHEASALGSAKPMVTIPAKTGSSSSPVCRYRVVSRNSAGSAAKYEVANRVPLRYDAMRNSVNGISGACPRAAYRRSQATNSAANTRKTVSSHHRRGSSSGEPVVNRNGHINASTVIPKRITPTGSSAMRRPVWTRVVGSTQTAAAMAAIPNGTFIQKIQRQPSFGPPRAIMSPPSVGPNAVASPIVAPNKPNARPRSAPWKIC